MNIVSPYLAMNYRAGYSYIEGCIGLVSNPVDQGNKSVMNMEIGPDDEDSPQRNVGCSCFMVLIKDRRKLIHFLFVIFAALLAVLFSSIAIGTTNWSTISARRILAEDFSNISAPNPLQIPPLQIIKLGLWRFCIPTNNTLECGTIVSSCQGQICGSDGRNCNYFKLVPIAQCASFETVRTMFLIGDCCFCTPLLAFVIVTLLQYRSNFFSRFMAFISIFGAALVGIGVIVYYYDVFTKGNEALENANLFPMTVDFSFYFMCFSAGLGLLCAFALEMSSRNDHDEWGQAPAFNKATLNQGKIVVVVVEPQDEICHMFTMPGQRGQIALPLDSGAYDT